MGNTLNAYEFREKNTDEMIVSVFNAHSISRKRKPIMNLRSTCVCIDFMNCSLDPKKG